MMIQAPAKINLHLRVGPPREDGFHPLLSWMCVVGLADQIRFEKSDDPGIRLSCSDPALPTDGQNLVYRAAELLVRSGQGVKIHLVKNIPDGAGLGGGSSDAAATLKALAGLLGRTDDLAPLAARVGSDVPFFLHAPSAICRGRGELVEPIDPPAVRHVVLALPSIKMPTPAVYRKLDELKTFGPVDGPVDFAAWTRLPARQLLPLLVNDLETPAFAINPQLGQLREDLSTRLGRIVRMSGSGSSLFSLFDDPQEAQHAAAQISSGFSVRAVATSLGVL